MYNLSLDGVMEKDRAALYQYWVDMFGSVPNRTLRTEFLRQAVSWQVQARIYGGLDAASRKALKFGISEKGMSVGTKLIREWQGVRHQVTILANGFEYAGAKYRSLSAIARKITGTSWNGLVFFGVKK